MGMAFFPRARTNYEAGRNAQATAELRSFITGGNNSYAAHENGQWGSEQQLQRLRVGGYDDDYKNLRRNVVHNSHLRDEYKLRRR